mmetsp:Transcript_11994/g.33906  ORF Transcript_11994/g.33906 Transcript_11994/m.33906 type:complete len:278 (+) Transcript_11994:257-1090(+)
MSCSHARLPAHTTCCCHGDLPFHMSCCRRFERTSLGNSMAPAVHGITECGWRKLAHARTSPHLTSPCSLNSRGRGLILHTRRCCPPRRDTRSCQPAKCSSTNSCACRCLLAACVETTSSQSARVRSISSFLRHRGLEDLRELCIPKIVQARRFTVSRWWLARLGNRAPGTSGWQTCKIDGSYTPRPCFAQPRPGQYSWLWLRVRPTPGSSRKVPAASPNQTTSAAGTHWHSQPNHDTNESATVANSIWRHHQQWSGCSIVTSSSLSSSWRVHECPQV